MKSLALVLSFGLMMSAQAQAWTQIATCGTGDAIAGLDIFTDGQEIIIQILSQNDEAAPDQFQTKSADLTAVLKKVSNGQAQTLVLSKPDSNSFGGAISQAALLNLKVHKKHSYKRNSIIGVDGDVISLFCNTPKN